MVLIVWQKQNQLIFTLELILELDGRGTVGVPIYDSSYTPISEVSWGIQLEKPVSMDVHHTDDLRNMSSLLYAFACHGPLQPRASLLALCVCGRVVGNTRLWHFINSLNFQPLICS